MNASEFAEVIAMLETAVGRPIAPTPREALERTRVYNAMLADLPINALRAAAEEAAATFKPEYGVMFPPIAMLRQLAIAAIDGATAAPPFDEIWQAVVVTAQQLSYVKDPSYVMIRYGERLSPSEFNERLLSKLPPAAERAMRRFGIHAIREDDFCRSQFRKFYEEITEREQHDRLLPPSVAKRIADVGEDNAELAAARCRRITNNLAETLRAP